MKQKESGITVLTRLLAVLEREKEILIKSEANKLDDIVKEKENFLQELPNCNFEEAEQADVKELVHLIQQLQETNLMLTQQTLRLQDTILSAISKGAKHSGNTYSSKGRHTAASQASLLNQSL